MRRALIVIGAGVLGTCLFPLLSLLPCHDPSGCPDIGFFWLMGLSIGGVSGAAIGAAYCDGIGLS